MPRPKTPVDRERAQERLRELHRQIAAVDYVCSGTLHRRTKLCGKKNCACGRDPAARHGPYFQWSRRKGGRQDNTVIPGAAVPGFRRAVANYRKIRTLLRAWEDESAKLLLSQENTKA